MSITPIKVRIVKRPIIKARFVPQLPANLTGRTAIAVERNGSIYYVDLDYSKLAESLSFDPAQNVVAILRSDGVWHKTTVATLSTMIGADKPNLVAIANAATSADKLGYWSGPAQYSLTDFTTYMRTLLDDPDATTARATLGLVIGTDVQPHDAELDALAGLVSAADRLPYFTGPGTAALTVLTPFARTLLDDVDAAAMRTTIDAQQHDTDLDAIAALTPTDDDFIQRKASAWVSRSIAQVKTDLAINNVDNTSDLNKPISTATQGALDLKADKATTVSAGTGLTGGGDLSANRSVALSSASIASLGKADTAVQPARAVSAGTGLTGGGDLSADRTIALDTASQASLAKADTAVQPGALATVATTGAYSDLTGKPYTVPVGGVAGQVLAKKTSADGDTEWVTGGGGGGGGDMLASMYDPNNVQGDAFEYANFRNVPRGHLWGLTLSNNATDATNDIDIAAGEAVDNSNASIMRLAATLTKRLDAAWAVGSGNGGLDTGSVADGTYHVFLIRRSDTGIVDALFSTSATSPTMPASYDRKRRIGSIIRKSAAILPFTQRGDYFLLKTSASDFLVTAGTGWSHVAVTAPAGVRTRPLISAYINHGANVTVTQFYVADGDEPAAPTAALWLIKGVYASDGAYSNTDQIFTNLSSQIRVIATFTGTAVGVGFDTRGWIDTRGRLAE